jgi:hypothetical protein
MGRILDTVGMPLERSTRVNQLEPRREALQRLFNILRNEGQFEFFDTLIHTQGQKGMKYLMDIDGEEHYIQTGGDWMQTLWGNEHTRTHEECFGWNVAQALFSKWVGLPQLVHGSHLGRTVQGWAQHPLADHNEAVTTTLPSRALHEYCALQASYHALVVEPAAPWARGKCRFINGRGIYASKCGKKAEDNKWGLCRMHALEASTRLTCTLAGMHAGLAEARCLHGEIQIANRDFRAQRRHRPSGSSSSSNGTPPVNP